jgi:hypothetical protein
VAVKVVLCSVVWKNERYINKNLELMNLDGVDWQWNIVNYTNGQLELDFNVVPSPKYREDVADGYPHKISIEHGLGLNRCLEHVSPDTDYIVLLDPDFFVLPPVLEIIDHMKQNDLVCFGSPYMKRDKVVQDCPVAFCLFIDGTKVKPHRLDFTPGFGKYKSFDGKDNQWMHADTGFKFYMEQYFDKKVKYEAVTPSYQHLNEENKWLNRDEYFWQDKLFGVHTRAKLHHSSRQTQDLIDTQLSLVERIFRDSRS